MRTVTSETITRTVKNLCLRANKFLPSDIKLTLDTALDYEISPNGKRAIHSSPAVARHLLHILAVLHRAFERTHLFPLLRAAEHTDDAAKE